MSDRKSIGWMGLLVWPACVAAMALGCAEAQQDDDIGLCPRPAPRCGDGCTDYARGEQCDDGNHLGGDGCAPDCRLEGGADGDADADAPPDDGWVPEDAPPDDAPPVDDGGRDDGTTDTGSCPESPCRLMPQCGCPAGEKCTVDPASTGTSLIKQCTAAGTSDATRTCAAEEECRAGTGCFLLFSSSGAVENAMCYSYCASPSDCSGAGSVCMALTSTSSYPGTCSHPCNILTNSGCPSGTKCMPYILTSTSQQLTDCGADVGAGTAGSYCLDDTDCGIGTFCATSVGECIQFCQYPFGSCAMARTCNQFTDELGTPDPVLIGGVEYGYCY